ncbi:nineteen complex-related protein 2-domain-containing protein [Lipomyces kononenkoae]
MATFGPANRFKKAASNRRARPKLTFEDEETENGANGSSAQASTVKDNAVMSGEKQEAQPTVHSIQRDVESAVDDSSSVSRDRVRRTVTTNNQDDDDDGQESYHVVTASSLKKMRKSKTKELSSSLLNSQLRAKLAPNLPGFSGNATSAPTYSKAYLDELRDSTPTTPAEYANSDINADERGDIDLPDDSRYHVDTAGSEGVAAMPDEALISHLIQQRHKTAEGIRNDEFVSLDDEADNDEAHSDMDGVEMYDKHENERTSRLQREDDVLENEYEMIAEGSDGRIPLSATQEAEQKMQRRRDIEEMINDREDEERQFGDEYHYIGENDSGSDSGWEEEQIRKGAFGSKAFSTKHADVESNGIPKQSGTQQSSFRVLQQLPDLESVTKRLAVILDGMREERDSHLKLLEELNTQKEEIEAREKELKEALSAAPF